MVPDCGGPAQTAWFTFSYNALRNEDGTVCGIFITGIETTERVRAVAALLASEQQFEALLNQAPLGVYLVDSGLVIQEVNPVALPVFGDIPGGPVGRNFDEVIRILWNKEYADELVGIFRQTLETGESYVTPERAEYRSDRNSVEYYEWRLDRMALPGGQYGVVCYFRDISAQVHARHEIEKARECGRANEERQAFLLKLSDTLRPLGDALEVQTAALRVLGEHLAVNRAFFNEVDEDRDAFVIHRTYANGVAPLIGHFRLSDVQRTAELAGSGQTVVVDDASADPRLSQAERASYAAMEVAAGIGVPLIKDGRWVAGLGVHHVTPRHWTPEDIDLVREVAERTWAAVERARAEAALRASEAKYRMLFDAMDQGFYIAEMVEDETGRAIDRRFLEVNSAMERISGLSNVVGRLMSEFAPNAEAHWIEPFEHVVRTGEPRRVEDFNVDTGRWYQTSHTRIGGQSSRLVGVLFDDITERKQTETALRDSEALQAFLLKFSDTLRPLGDRSRRARGAGRSQGPVRAVGTRCGCLPQGSRGLVTCRPRAGHQRAEVRGPVGDGRPGRGDLAGSSAQWRAPSQAGLDRASTRAA